MRFHSLSFPLMVVITVCALPVLSQTQDLTLVPNAPHWTQQHDSVSKNGPQLKLFIHATVEGESDNEEFKIRVHKDNQPWCTVQRKGNRPFQFKVPSGHLYTVEVSHEAAYQKVIQCDTQGLDRPMKLHCDIDLMYKGDHDQLTFDDELLLSMPLSVVWFDKKRNLFQHDAYLHNEGIAHIRSHLSLRDTTRHVTALKANVP